MYSKYGFPALDSALTLAVAEQEHKVSACP